jgi:hypothetical protein
VNYNLTFHVSQPHRTVDAGGAGEAIPEPDAVAVTPEAPAHLPFVETHPPITVLETAQAEPVAAGARAEEAEQRAATPAPPTVEYEQGPEAPPEAEPETLPAMDRSELARISDNLVDIIVYATMALKRFERGRYDREGMEVLYRKIRAKAMKAHRRARRLSIPDKPDNPGD